MDRKKPSGSALPISQQQSMVDLHGLSPEKAQRSVNWHLSVAQQTNTETLRFVTGRGNHINSKGERGTLFREFPNWLSAENRKNIASVTKFDGYYEIKMQPAHKHPFDLSFKDLTEQLLISNIKSVKEYAEGGDHYYQFLLGHCYQYGIGVELKYEEAFSWYEKSAEKNVFAEYALGGCYWQGKGVRQNDDKAMELFKSAAAKKFPWALHQLGDIYFYGEGVKSDPALGQSYYQQAADLDIAKRKLAHIFFWDKVPGQKDQKKAFDLYKEVADRGDAHSAFNVACAYKHGTGVKQDPIEAFKYAKKAADGKDPDAQYLTYMFYMEGFGTKKDTKQANHYLTLAASNNFKHALLQLAFLTDVEQQKNEYLIRAAKADQIVAQAMVLKLLPDDAITDTERKMMWESFWKQSDEEFLSCNVDYFKFMVIDAYMQNENLTKKQKAKILHWLDILAKENYPKAFTRLGAIYKGGYIAQKDMKKVEKNWLKGAELGNASCWTSLGYFYEEQNEFEKAYECYVNGANLKDANSFNQLGLMYKEGKGTKKDLKEAKDCFLSAMSLDSGEEKYKQYDGWFYVPTYLNAAYNLGMLFLLGDKTEGFPADPKQAVFWFIESENAGHPEAKKALDQLQVPRTKDTSQAVQTACKSIFWKKPSDEPAAAVTVVSQEKPGTKELLNSFTEALNLKVDWKITKNDQAWCYIETKEVPRLKKLSLEPFELKKTKDGKFILLLETLSKHDIAAITNKLMTPSNNISLRC